MISSKLSPNRLSNSPMKVFLYTGHSQSTCTTLTFFPTELTDDRHIQMKKGEGLGMRLLHATELDDARSCKECTHEL